MDTKRAYSFKKPLGIGALTSFCFLFSINTFAIDVPKIPLGNKDVEKAINKAAEAALIQSGYKESLDDYANRVLKDYEQFIRDWGYFEEISFVGYTAKILIDQELSFQTRNFLIKDSKCKFSLSPEKIEVGFKIKFD